MVVNLGCGRALAAAVGVAFDDEFVAGGGEPVDGGLGQQRVGHQTQPFTWKWHTFSGVDLGC